MGNFIGNFMEKLLFCVLTATVCLLAFNEDVSAATQLSYHCEVVIAASDVSAKGGIFSFEAPVISGSHGGDPRLFSEGVHQVQVVADAQWLGISWSKSGVKIAEALFVLAPLDRTLTRVGILYDPTDSGDQVSINCSEAPLAPPTPAVSVQ